MGELDLSGVPVLSDGVVTLRAHRWADVPAIVEQSRDPQTARFTTVPQPYDEDHARAFLTESVAPGWAGVAAQEADAARYWAIQVPDPDGGGPRYGGTIDVRPSGDAAEVGFALHPAVRGHGHTARALRLVVDHAFGLGTIETLHWLAVVGNWASRRTAWRCGFRVEGRARALLRARPGEPRPDSWIATLRRGDPRVPAHPWYVAPTLTTADAGGHAVRLRQWRDDDAAGLPEARDPVTERFLGPAVPTRAEFPAWLDGRREPAAAGTGVSWAVTDGEDALLGLIQLFDLGRDRRGGNGTLGVYVLPHARGRGLFGTALDVVLDWAFASPESPRGGLGLARVRADADADNAASVQTMLRRGMRLTGRTRAERPDTRPGHEGERIDMVQLESLAGDERGLSRRD